MDQVPQFTIVTAVSNGALERRIGTLAEQAARIGLRFYANRLATLYARRQMQGFSANGAMETVQRSNCE
jgi:hypothetical protein